jgi:hypothetical protein
LSDASKSYNKNIALPLAMIFLRRHRLISVLLALISLLSMQMAVAGHVCPDRLAKLTQVAAMAEAGMPCAESMAMDMDNEQPGLCHAHCQSDHQSADKYELPALAALPVGAPSFSPGPMVPVVSLVAMQRPLLQRSTAPPLAVRNCCFRI